MRTTLPGVLESKLSAPQLKHAGPIKNLWTLHIKPLGRSILSGFKRYLNLATELGEITRPNHGSFLIATSHFHVWIAPGVELYAVDTCVFVSQADAEGTLAEQAAGWV